MRLIKYLKPYLLFAIVSPLLMMAEVAADLCLPYMMSYIVDYGIDADGLVKIGESPLAKWGMDTLWGVGDYTRMNVIITFGILMLVIVLFGGFFGTFCAYTAARAAQGFGHDLRLDAYRRVMSLSLEQTDKFTTGSLVTRMTNDISMMVEFIEMLLRMFVRAPMFLVGGSIMLLSLDIKFGTVIVIALPILLATMIIVLSRAIPMYSVVQNKLDRVNCVVQENVSGARVVKAYVREDHEKKRFGRANDELRSINYRVLKLMAVNMPVLHVVQNIAIIAIIYIGGSSVAIGIEGMSTGTIMAAINYITNVIMSVMSVTMMFQSVSRALASGKRICEVLDTAPAVVGGMSGDDLNIKTSSTPVISMKGVGFRYPGTVGRPVLHDIDLEVYRGETVAIIGATGCGKSSLVNLIPRFYDATEGEIVIDGTPIRDYDLEKLRAKIGFVMQKSELFSDTVANNIKWGKPDATVEEIKEAAQAAQASDFIEGFADGYDTFIAEKGASLSGGQKQRMSIARAMIRRPEIMILDDATSALDLATEAKLQRALKEKLDGTTVIMIAQRIASVKNADRIAVIEDGTIKDIGSHDVLMETSETYRDIYESQMKNGGAANE